MKTLEQARIYAAKTNRDHAEDVLCGRVPFPAHVTENKKQEISENSLRLAEQIEAGEHDHVFTVAQRIHYYMTGECVQLLP